MSNSSDRWMLSILENAKTAVEKVYPNDKNLINHLTQALTLVCYKIKEKESKND